MSERYLPCRLCAGVGEKLLLPLPVYRCAKCGVIFEPSKLNGGEG